MPTYRFQDTKTGKKHTKFMTISELDVYLKDNPQLEQLVNGAPMIGYTTTRKKPDSWFREKLQTIKRKNRGSTVNTW